MNTKLSENYRGGYSPTKKLLTKFMTNAWRTSRRRQSLCRMHTESLIELLKTTLLNIMSICSVTLTSADMKLAGKAV